MNNVLLLILSVGVLAIVLLLAAILVLQVKWRSPKAVLCECEPMPTVSEWAEIAERAPFWVCDSCGQEFRLSSSGITPEKCPCCGGKMGTWKHIADAESRAASYQCQFCKEDIEMLDGRQPACCPCCGRELEEFESKGEQ